MSRKISGLLVAAMALACVVGTSTRADAAFIAYICDDAACAGGNDAIVTDQGAGDNFPGSALAGQINAGAVNIAGFTIITNVSQSKPLIGSASAPQLDLTFSAVTNDNLSHTVFLYAADTGFTGTGTILLTLGGTQSPGGDGNTVQGRVWAGAVNTNTADPRGAGPLLVSTPSIGVTPFAVSANGALSPAVNPYAFAIGVQITRGSAGTTTGNLNVAVPEPASMALFGLGLMGVGMVNRRRRAKQAK